MANKIKIGFEITDTWTRQEFRELLKLIIYTPEAVCSTPDTDFELYLISTDSSSYISLVAKTINAWFPDIVVLDSNHIVTCQFVEDKVQACINNNIDVYFDADNRTVVNIEVETPNTWSILVRTEADRYKAKQKYATEFQNVLKTIISERAN